MVVSDIGRDHFESCWLRSVLVLGSVEEVITLSGVGSVVFWCLFLLRK